MPDPVVPPLDLVDLAGRRALVTGSSRGIGRDIALRLAACGADVCVHCAGAEDEAREVAALIGHAARRSCVVSGDLSDTATPTSIVSGAVSGLGGPVDLLIANASIQVPQPFEEIDADTARRQFDANFLGTLALVQQVVPDMRRAGFGRIVNVGSVQQWRPHPGMLVYAGLKSGVENMMRNLAVQLAPNGITVNTVAPGAIETDRNRDSLSDPAYREAVLCRIPAGRIGRPQDCAGIIALLCGPAGDYITGADIPVDGGMRLG